VDAVNVPRRPLAFGQAQRLSFSADSATRQRTQLLRRCLDSRAIRREIEDSLKRSIRERLDKALRRGGGGTITIHI
jgi:hypothetical protein